MTLTPSARESAPASGARPRTALAVADVNWFTTENLFLEVDRPDVSSLLLTCVDYRNALQRGQPPWAWFPGARQSAPSVWRHDLVLPSGWMKSYPGFGMRPIVKSIRSWQADRVGESALTLVMTYPHYLYLRDQVRPERSVYFNIDDYAMYWPKYAERVGELERQAVRESDLTVCVSKVRADRLREDVPEAADRVRHLPHGAPSHSVAERPWRRPAPAPADLEGLPRPYLGYVGTLEDRVDWALLARLSEAFPEGTVVIIGRRGPRSGAFWSKERLRCLSRPNVRLLGWRPQETIPLYNRSFDACLIPYLTDHPFNMASSPTKIMDTMGTGRPIVSTDLPECRLYDHLFHVAEGPEAFIDAVRSVVDSGSDDGRASLRHDWARAHTCRRVADQLFDWLSA